MVDVLIDRESLKYRVDKMQGWCELGGELYVAVGKKKQGLD